MALRWDSSCVLHGNITPPFQHCRPQPRFQQTQRRHQLTQMMASASPTLLWLPRTQLLPTAAATQKLERKWQQAVKWESSPDHGIQGEMQAARADVALQAHLPRTAALPADLPSNRPAAAAECT